MAMSLEIVLVQPVIPQNTGSIGRLCAANNFRLHLIEPLGFSLEDRYLKRAGLDYWSEIQLIVHPSWQAFIEAEKVASDQLHIFTTKAESGLFEASFASGDYLVFGGETSGLPQSFHLKYPNRRVRIPMKNPRIRSLNLSNAVGIAVFCAMQRMHLENLGCLHTR